MAILNCLSCSGLIKINQVYKYKNNTKINCPKCSKKMVEIELAYNESHVAKYVEKPVHQYIPIPFVDMLVGGTILLAAAARDKYGENEVKR